MPFFVEAIGIITRFGILDAWQQEIDEILSFRRLRQCAGEPRRNVKDRIDDVRVVDVVSADQGGIDGSRWLAIEQVVNKFVRLQKARATSQILVANEELRCMQRPAMMP